MIPRTDIQPCLLDTVLKCIVVTAALTAGGVEAWQPTESVAGDDKMEQRAVSASADEEMDRGRTRFKQGAFAQAAVHWSAAATRYEQEGKAKEQCQALINLAHALQQEGQVKKAVATLQAALNLSEHAGNRTLTASIFGRLGNAAYALGKGDQAVDHLRKGLRLARDEKNTVLVAVLLNDLGNVLSSRRQFTEAVDVYAESKSLATRTAQRPLAVTAQINMAMAFLEDQQWAESERQLDIASSDIRTLDDSYSKTYGLLNIGLGYDDLRSALSRPRMMAELERQTVGGTRAIGEERPVPQGAPAASGLAKDEGPVPSDNSLVRQAANSFVTAAQVATRLDDSRGQSYAWGYLGSLLERERRPAEALDFTRQAVFAAQKGNIPESLYRWHWQTARLLKAAGKEDEALAAYQRSVSILKPIRYEYSVGYQGRHHSFSESVAPLFTELEDAVLRRAAVAQTQEQTQQLLTLVRDTIEASHAAELQDYFRDDCVATARSRRGDGQAVSAQTAILYPIVLPDRLELLVNTSGGLKRYAVPVTAETLTREIRAFRGTVQNGSSQNYLGPAKTLYGWLMAPLQQDFLASGVTTVVVVPDGPLRTVPFAALHDGRQFVVSKYALAVTPGMDLTDPRPGDRSKISLLSMALTGSVQGFSALPRMAAEVDNLNTMYNGHSLVDKQFVVPSVEREMKGTEFGIVHIASHSVVEHDVNDSFLLAYDDKITMDRLSQLVGLLHYRNTPLELLTLSACDTAVGDDRAALGLSGMAVKAGARSALTSLWVSDDKAASDLIGEFYRQLQDPSITKAAALQRAQQRILSEPEHSHPVFWAPFLLMNNWM